MIIANAELKRIISSISGEVNKELKEKASESIEVIEQISSNGLPTPVLSVCGHGTQEIRFTKYFAYFLDVNQYHGLHDLVLKSAFDPEAIEAGLPEYWYKNCKVYAEYYLGQVFGVHSYVDILIKGDGFVLSVEQKLFSSESNANESDMGQLQRYSAALDDNKDFKDLHKVNIYLTPNGKMPENAQGWMALTHEELTRRLLPLIDKESVSYTAAENLRRLLLDFILGPYKKTAEVIQELEKTATMIAQRKYPISATGYFIKQIEKHELLMRILKGGKRP